MAKLSSRFTLGARVTRDLGRSCRSPASRSAVRDALAILGSTELAHRSCRTAEMLNTLQSIAAVRESNLAPPLVGPRGKDARAFILGSGPSVNNLSDTAWKYIGDHDSFGFNNWFRHSFVPNHYVVQASKSPQVDERMAKWYLERQKDYRDCRFIVRGDRFNEGTFGSSAIGRVLAGDVQLSCVAELYFMSYCTADPVAVLDAVAGRNLFESRRDLQLLPKMGATLPLIVSLCLASGYGDIILVGIDMNDASHFFDAGIPDLGRSESSRSSDGTEVHPHVDTGSRQWTVVDVVSALSRLAGESFQSRIWVASKTSRLASVLPVWTADRWSA